ncbi:hypothetical protein ACFL4W_00935 [Planctomycetota bacterium]
MYTVFYAPEHKAEYCLVACMPWGEERRNVSHTVNGLLQKLAEKGWVTGMFDYPGCGESTGTADDFTLASALAAGQELCDHLEDVSLKLTVLGIRAGAFTAAELAGDTRKLVLWQPFLEGSRVLKELTLKEKIRGSLTANKLKGTVLLDGEPLSETLKKELSEASLDAEALPHAQIVQISQNGRVLPQYKKAAETDGFSIAEAPPFWNAHEDWDCSGIIEHTAAILTGE